MFFFFFYSLLFSGLTKIFGVKLKKSGEQKEKKVLFVSNHISYLDILILGSVVRGVFVAKSEIRNWPIINKLCLLGKTIFIERFNPRSVKKQMNLIGRKLTRELQNINSKWAWTCSKCGFIVRKSTRKFRSNYFHKECKGKLENIPIIHPTKLEH